MYKKDYWMVLGLLEEIDNKTRHGHNVFVDVDGINNQIKEALKILRGYDGNNVN